MALTQVQPGMLGATQPYNFKNRIINGAMVIDQRNAGASVTPNGSYTLDRWRSYNTQTSKFTVQQNAGSVTPPVGFKDYLGVTSLSAYSVTSSDYFGMFQPIEGFNFADMGWGTANAKTVTLSFWAYSSLTGTFGGALNNATFDRSYPFAYTITTANTWQQVSITIAGDTTGTWVGATNGVGVYVIFGLGAGSTVSSTAGAWASGFFVSATGATSVVGTSGATFYITGVQLELGVTATSFDYRVYGQELALCQRYLPYWGAGTAFLSFYNSSTGILAPLATPVPCRVAPTGLTFSASNALGGYNGLIGGFTPTTLAFNSAGLQSVVVQCNYTGLTTGQAGNLNVAGSNYFYATGCEL